MPVFKMKRQADQVLRPMLAKLPVKQIDAGGSLLMLDASYWQPLYDVKTTGTASMNELTFFDQGHRNGRSWESTNVPTPGKTPGGVVFAVHGYAVKISAAATTVVSAADFLQFQLGLFTFQVGDSVRFRMPLQTLGGLGGVGGLNAAAATYFVNGSSSTNDYWRNPSADFDEPITAEQSFKVTLSWASAYTPVAS